MASAKKSGNNGGARLYLVDASSYAFRAYHATMRQALATSGGMPTGAASVFTRMLLKLVREESPTHVAVVWDSKGKTFRHDIYPAYKANRAETPEDLKPQFEYMARLVDAFNLKSVRAEGYEADDVIGTLARRAEAEGIDTVIVSGDKDMTQLVSGRVTMLDTLKDVRADREGVAEKMGVPPEKVTDLMALWGDSSDNIPGVPKVGEKTAKKLMAEHGSLDAILENAADIKGKVGENLREFAEQARLSKKLVTIDTEVPIDFEWDDFIPGEPDRDELNEIFDELEFRQMKKEFGKAKTKIGYDGYRLITSEADLGDIAARVREKGAMAVDTETTSLNQMEADLVGVSLAIEPGRAVYIPVAHSGFDAGGQLKKETVLDALRPLLESEDIEKTGQNLKYDYTVLRRQGIETRGIGFDTMVASYVLDPKRRAHNLDDLAADHLGHTTIKYEDLCGKGKKQKPFAEVPLEDALRYAGEDADVTLLLRGKLEPELGKGQLRKLFDEIEMPLVPVLARMEMTGVKVDTGKLMDLSREFEGEIGKLRDKIFERSGEEFNVDSPKQLAEVLFDKLGLPPGKKTKTGYSTSVEVLDKLAEEHEVPGLVLEYRSLAKLKSTYTDALARLALPETGRIHTSYNQTVTSTGRLSSSEPNLQNIPVRQGIGRRIREAFVGEGDNLIMSADYSQIELRIMAHISGEPALLEAFANNEDIHLRTAAEIFGIDPDKVTPDQRRHAKVVNFGILYGMSAHGLTKQLDVEHKEAQAYIDAYFSRYPKVREYMDRVTAGARDKGYVETIMGRRMPLPEIKSGNHIVRQAAEREAVNAPLQGSAADIIKVAMIALDKKLREKKFESPMIMQVHDELVFEVVPSEEDELRELVKKEMESAARLEVALVVDTGVGANWSEAH